MHTRMKRLALLGALWAVGTSASATEVSLSGSLGQRALLVIEGQVRTVAVGATVDGVRLLELGGGQAVVEVAGQRLTLRMGESPVNLGAGADGTASQIVLTAGSGGHFIAGGRINNREVRFMVDTGASNVAMSAAQADRLALNYRAGQRVHVNTANGTVPGHVVNLDSVRVGDVEVFNVVGIVTPSDMPYVLLGNSFLNRFQLRRDNNQMTLTRRY